MKRQLNLIVIATDTLRADHLGCYGNDWIRTPNLDGFARDSIVFESVWGEGLPTMQARRVWFTGRTILPFVEWSQKKQPKGLDPPLPGWRPLRDDDVALAEALRERGYYTGLVTDNWHFFKPNMNLHRGFRNWQFIRGQECDPWRTAPKGKFNPRDHIPPHLVGPEYDRRMWQYLANTQDMRSEEDYFCARTFRTAVQWLKDNADKKPFFLWAETFSPHEVFDPPKAYAEIYHKDYPCERMLFGYGIEPRNVRPEDIPAIHGLYCGMVMLVDRWIGHLLDTIKRLGLYEDTVIAFTSDHGCEFGDHGGAIQKPATLLHPPLTQLPLIIHHPDAALVNKRVGALISAVDFMPTFLHLLGIEGPDRMTGVDFWPAVMEDKEVVREYCVTGYCHCGAVRTLDWNLIFPAPSECHIFKPHVFEPRLFDVRNDPKELTDIAPDHPEVVEELLRLARRTWPSAPARK